MPALRDIASTATAATLAAAMLIGSGAAAQAAPSNQPDGGETQPDEGAGHHRKDAQPVDKSPYADGQPGQPAAQAPEGAVELSPDMQLQQAVDAHPAGTTFFLTAGTYRQATIQARSGDTFIGAPGAVLSGAKDLTNAGWQREGNLHFIAGQTQQGWVSPAHTLAEGGNAAHMNPEMLFVDDVMWQPVAKGQLDVVGEWYFDYDADRIYVAADPAGLGLIEAAATSYALHGEYTSGVTVENLVVEKYATRSSHGAIHAHNTDSWTLTNITSQQNHGGGITVGPGTVVESSHVQLNGQIGIVGYGTYRQGAKKGQHGSRPVAVRNTEINDNLTLDYWWGFEGGGTKFKETDGMVFEGNHSHDNNGPGLWWDVYNNGAIIQDNLVENNEIRGIMYELSFGPTKIVNNLVRDNGTDVATAYLGSQIYISSSTGVEVANNTVSGGTRGIVVRNDQRRTPRTTDVQVHDNDIAMADASWTGMKQDNGVEDAKWADGAITFSANTYRVGRTSDVSFFWENGRMSFAAWQQTVNGAGSSITTDRTQTMTMRAPTGHGAR